MHFLRLFLAFIQKLCLLSLHFSQKLIKGGLEYEGGGLENFSKIYKRGGGDDYSVLESTCGLFGLWTRLANCFDTYSVQGLMLVPSQCFACPSLDLGLAASEIN